MEVQQFIYYLWKQKIIIVGASILTAILTFFFVQFQDEKYTAEATLSTGVLGPTGLYLEQGNAFKQEYQIRMYFDNLVTALGSRKNLNFLIYQLLIHDLDEGNIAEGKNFRELNLDHFAKNDFEISTEELNAFTDRLRRKSDTFEFSFQDDVEGQIIFNRICEAFGYDYKELIEENMKIFRVGSSDNIKVLFESESAELSAFAANTFCEESVRVNYHSDRAEIEDQVKSTAALLQNKRNELDELNNRKRLLMTSSNIVDAGREAESLINQKEKLVQDREELSNRGLAIRENIKKLEKDLNNLRREDQANSNNSLTTNLALSDLNSRIKTLETDYIASNRTDESIKKNLADAKAERDSLLNQYANEIVKQGNVVDTKDTQDDLFRRKTELELELTNTEQRMASIDSALARLSDEQKTFVGNDALLKNLNSELEIAQKEYESLLSEARGSERVLDTDQFPLKVLEYAEIPEKPKSKKRTLYAIAGGVGGGGLASLFLLILLVMERSLKTPSRFQQFTDLNLIGIIPAIDVNNLNFKELFIKDQDDHGMDLFRESIRNLRFVIESAGVKKILFTSTPKSTGKSFLIASLAHVLQMKGSKVLLIDTNLKNNTLTKMFTQQKDLKFLSALKLIGDQPLDEDSIWRSESPGNTYNLDDIDIIGNNGSNLSPSEIFVDQDVASFIDALEQKYDFIFLEGPSLNNYLDSKELVTYVDKVIAVFSSENVLSQKDYISIDFLKNLNHNFMGALLNKVSIKDLDE